MSADANAVALTAPSRDVNGDASRDVAGMVLARLSVVPALFAMAWLLAGLVLLWAGWFRPVPVTLLAVVLAVPLMWFGVRAVPSLPARAAAGLPGMDGRTPWWPLAAVGVIAVAFFAQQAICHSQFVFITRDPGAYFQFATWIAKHGSLPVPSDAAAFGGTHGGLVTSAGDATYLQGDGTVALEFVAGLPMVLAGAMWVGGYQAALLMAPLLGTLAVVTFAGLAARLIGARWAPLAALIVAVSLPMQFTSRATYSEPLAEILLLGGLALVLDGLREGRGARRLTGLGGLALGLTVLVRIDGASDILPVIPFCGALFVSRRPQAAWLAGGLAAGTVLGAGEGLVFSWPYLMQTDRSSVLPLAALIAGALAVTAAGTWWFRHRPLPLWPRWLPHAALPTAFAVAVVFWLRPYVQSVGALRGPDAIAAWEQECGLYWVEWYLGLPVILAAIVGAGLLARSCLRGRAGSWALPLMVLCWVTVTILYRPDIPEGDQPWASRRLVPGVIPAFVLLAVWVLARGSAWLAAARADAGRTDASRFGTLLAGRGTLAAVVRAAAALRPALVTACALAVVLPAVIANWGLGVSVSGGVQLSADGAADSRDYQGELAAMQTLCAALPANASVIFIGAEAQQILQGIRGMCGVPAVEIPPVNLDGQLLMPPGANLAGVAMSAAADVEQTGRVPVILAQYQDNLNPYEDTGAVQQVFTLNTTQDPSVYQTPKQPGYRQFSVWMWHP